MAEQDIYNGVTIEKSWSLLAFAKENGLPKLREDVNKESGEVFNSLSFPEAIGGRIFCHFGRSTQGMTMEDIIKEKDNLKVGLNSNGKYTLYKQEEKGEVIQLW